MRCTTDRIRRAVCFEIIGILTVTPIFARMFGHPMGNMGRGGQTPSRSRLATSAGNSHWRTLPGSSNRRSSSRPSWKA
ncbi:chlorhexidine efflux transporter [Thioclava nitratireducens]|uniref:chlorhexidine efflux transporter n=1 Tax=Thioclava nitratireducens TaxID=1915078 RepID=UPI00247FC3C1|nr:chlorhexidine efflux transporter [Thioclava nitratireducens]WGT51345.1 chlorhexidine efflux transporter [Thioclava nitratireducens]